MDLQLNNEINKNKNDFNSDVKGFMKDLQKMLNNSEVKVNVGKGLYDKIYNEIELAPKYKKQLNKIISGCMLDMSYEKNFIYVSYDKKTHQYYADIYDEGITRTSLTKKDIEEGNLRPDQFYYPINNFEAMAESDSMEEAVKIAVKYELRKLDRLNKRNANGK